MSLINSELHTRADRKLTNAKAKDALSCVTTEHTSESVLFSAVFPFGQRQRTGAKVIEDAV